MPRSTRAQFPGALYHLTARSEDGRAIFHDDEDRERMLALLQDALRRREAICYAYCLMGNHCHFVIRTWRANVLRLCNELVRAYDEHFSRRHGQPATLRPLAPTLLEHIGYLLEVCRYVDLNPVRAGLVSAAQDWPWSSYRAHAGLQRSPTWLNSAALHRRIGSRAPWRDGAALYARYVQQG